MVGVIDPAHVYKLPSANGGDSQEIRFVKKQPKKGSEELELVHDGTTNEAVIEVLIDRLTSAQAKVPCEHNEVAIASLKQALESLNARTAERQARGVEGTQKE